MGASSGGCTDTNRTACGQNRAAKVSYSCIPIQCLEGKIVIPLEA